MTKMLKIFKKSKKFKIKTLEMVKMKEKDIRKMEKTILKNERKEINK